MGGVLVRKEFTFRGKTMDELLAMSPEEFGRIAGARARRTLKRGFDKKLLKSIESAREQLKQGKKIKPLRTHLRDTIVIPQMVGLLFAVHNGKEFRVIEIQPDMLGHYMGEMALTRVRLMHGKAGIGATRSSTAIRTRG